MIAYPSIIGGTLFYPVGPLQKLSTHIQVFTDCLIPAEGPMTFE